MTPNPLPDSTKRLRWLVYGVAVVLYILSFFHRIAPGAIAGDLTLAFGLSGAQLGFLAATYFYLYTVLQIPTGVLADTLGPRRVLAFGGLVAGVGGLLFGLAPSYEWLLVARALVGGGVAVTFVCVLKLIANWFSPGRFASVAGLTILIGNLGSLTAAWPLTTASHAFGWRACFIAVGLLSLSLAWLAWRGVRDYPPGVQVRQTASAPSWQLGLRGVLANRATWPGFWFAGGIAGTYMTFNGLWVVPFLTEGLGLNRATASQYVTLMLVGFALSSFGLGQLSDRIRNRKLLMLTVGGVYCLAMGLLWRQGDHSLPLWLPFLLLGMGSSAFTLTWSIGKEVNPPALAGMAVSVVNTGMFLVVGLLQPWLGRVIDQSSQPGWPAYQQMMGWLVAVAVSGWLCGWLATETHGRNIHADH